MNRPDTDRIRTAASGAQQDGTYSTGIVDGAKVCLLPDTCEVLLSQALCYRCFGQDRRFAVLHGRLARPLRCAAWERDLLCVRRLFAVNLPADPPRGFDSAVRQGPPGTSLYNGLLLLLQASWTEGCSTFLRRLFLRYCEEVGTCNHCVEVCRQAASTHVPRQPCVQLSLSSCPVRTGESGNQPSGDGVHGAVVPSQSNADLGPHAACH